MATPPDSHPGPAPTTHTTNPAPHPTLHRDEYSSDATFDLECERIFRSGWMLAAPIAAIELGGRRVVEFAGESVIVSRDRDDTIRAFANVCRHRGAQLCAADDRGKGAIVCPYHSWAYAADGSLISTPHLDASEIDHSQLSLWAVNTHVWRGLVFISLAATPPPFNAWSTMLHHEFHDLARFPMETLALGGASSCVVEANWKIVLENYQECLHCTRVHPELVDRIPVYRSGWVIDDARPDGGVGFRDGFRGLSTNEHETLPDLPGLSDREACSYFGATMSPNGFVDYTGNVVAVTVLSPMSPTRTAMISYYMFAPDAVAADDFDPSGVIEFNDRITEQDNRVCELVQLGIRSSRFDHGTLTPKDHLVIGINASYRKLMDGCFTATPTAEIG